MFDKLKEIEDKFEELNVKLSDPEAVKDQAGYAQLAKLHTELEPIVTALRSYRKASSDLSSAQEMIKKETDPEMRKLFEDEIDDLIETRSRLETDLKEMLIEKDPRDDKDIIIEIRAGAGGEEASLFAGDLFRMYSRYAESRRWQVGVLEVSESDLQGYKEIIFEIKGKGAFSKFKYESGVHRVQRVPETESGGRIHTSTATVAVMPEVEAVDVAIDPNDVRVDTYRSSGAGGQHVNTTDSAVRLTHVPTGMVVTCQNERSQIQNREQAFKILRARLAEFYLEQQHKEIAQERREQVGTGDRSERIRTYNFPQNRVTDHRIGHTINNLSSVLEGNIDELIDALQRASRADQLKSAV